MIDLKPKLREAKKADKAAHTETCSHVMRSIDQQSRVDVTNATKE